MSEAKLRREVVYDLLKVLDMLYRGTLAGDYPPEIYAGERIDPRVVLPRYQDDASAAAKELLTSVLADIHMAAFLVGLDMEELQSMGLEEFTRTMQAISEEDDNEQDS